MFQVIRHDNNRLTISTDWISFPVFLEETDKGVFVTKSKAIWINDAEWYEIVRLVIDYWRKLPKDTH